MIDTLASSDFPTTLNGTDEFENCYLLETAYEVCNQIGGIYTVIRSKVPSMKKYWGDRYCTLGPYVDPKVSSNFEPQEELQSPLAQAAYNLRNKGFEVHVGHWLITGRPLTILFNPYSVYNRLGEIKYLLWEHHHISTPAEDDLLNQVVAFGFMVKEYLAELSRLTSEGGQQKIIAQYA